MPFSLNRSFFGQLFILLAGILFSSSDVLHAAGIGLRGGLSLASPSYEFSSPVVKSPSTASGFGIVMGIVAERQLSKRFSLETGLLFIRKRYELTATVNSKKVTATNDHSVYQVPLLLWFQLSPAISFAAGPYYSRLAPGSSPAGNKIADYGIQAGARFLFFPRRAWHPVIEARYSHGIANIATSSQETLKTRDYMALLGLSYTWGGKRK